MDDDARIEEVVSVLHDLPRERQHAHLLAAILLAVQDTRDLVREIESRIPAD